MKILLVDDDLALLMVASMALEDLGGMQVVRAQGGIQALTEAQNERPDAILMDIVLPDIDGTEVLKRLRQNEKTRDIPVIFHTAKRSRSEAKRLVAMGAKGVIVKPFDPMKLHREVQRILAIPG
ncbi:MAG: response regulator [Acidobacteriota bacterium]